jgi:hypothetical protein
VEWQLQDSAAVRTIVETVYNTTKKSEPNPLAPIPIGYDGQKRAYWQFGGKEGDKKKWIDKGVSLTLPFLS